MPVRAYARSRILRSRKSVGSLKGLTLPMEAEAKGKEIYLKVSLVLLSRCPIVRDRLAFLQRP